MPVEKTTYMNALFDFYGRLLTEKQQGYLQLYYGEDYSLGEIAEVYGVSRQAIFDNINRSEKTLQGFENHLHLVEQTSQRYQEQERLRTYVQDKYPKDQELLERINRLAKIGE